MSRPKSVLAMIISVVALASVSVGSASGGVGAAGAASTPGPLLADGLLVDSLPLPASAQPAAVTGGPVYYRTYAGWEFQPTDSDLLYAPLGAGMYAVAPLPPGFQSFKRALDLPNGVMVTKLTIYVIDNDPVNNITIQVTRNNPSVSTSQSYPASLNTTNAVSSASVQAVSLTGTITPIITLDNATYAYYLRYQPSVTGSLHVLVGVQVEFTVPTVYMPQVTK